MRQADILQCVFLDRFLRLLATRRCLRILQEDPSSDKYRHAPVGGRIIYYSKEIIAGKHDTVGRDIQRTSTIHSSDSANTGLKSFCRRCSIWPIKRCPHPAAVSFFIFILILIFVFIY